MIVIDAAHRVLLLFERGDGESEPYWYTPGGGIEPGETPETAARRELREELGFDVELGPPVLRRAVSFDVRGRHLDQDECHFLGRVPGGRAGVPVRDDAEAAAVEAARWWTLDEIRSSAERIYPEDLAALLEQALREEW